MGIRTSTRWIPIIALSTLPVAAFAAPAPAWQEVSRTREVTVYRKEIQDSPVLAYKAEATIAAPLAKVVAIVRDTGKLSEWAYRIKEAEIVEQVSPTERIEYVHSGAPWPVTDRDAVYKSKLTLDPASKRISLCMSSIEDPRRPVRKDRVRAQIDASCFYFTTPDGGKTTRVEAEVHGDPKGSIPTWVVNAVQQRAPGKTIHSLAERAAKPGVPDDPLALAFLN